jgi:plastocyanin
MKYNKGSARAIVVAAAAAVLLLVYFVTDPAMLSRIGIAGPSSGPGITPGTAPTAMNNTQHTVAVGGGNLSVAINQFSPSRIDIHRGESVTFYAPTGSTELHNAIFDLSNGSALSSIELAFILPPGFSPETLQLAPPDNFGEPIIQNMSDGRQSILALNKVLFSPSTVNQNGNTSYLQEHELNQEGNQTMQQGPFMPPPPLSANYTMQGNEKIVSSGLILDVAGFQPLLQGQQQQQQQQQQQPPTGGQVEQSPPPAYPILSNFTVTFNEPGVYPFFCAFHPGMGGVVNVTE